MVKRYYPKGCEDLGRDAGILVEGKSGTVVLYSDHPK